MVTSTGPFCSLAVVEIDRKVTEAGAALVATRDLTTGTRRAADMMDSCCTERFDDVLSL